MGTDNRQEAGWRHGRKDGGSDTLRRTGGLGQIGQACRTRNLSRGRAWRAVGAALFSWMELWRQTSGIGAIGNGFKAARPLALAALVTSERRIKALRSGRPGWLKKQPTTYSLKTKAAAASKPEVIETESYSLGTFAVIAQFFRLSAWQNSRRQLQGQWIIAEPNEQFHPLNGEGFEPAGRRLPSIRCIGH